LDLFSSDKYQEVKPLFDVNQYAGALDPSGKLLKYKFECKLCGHVFSDSLANGKIPRCFICHPIIIIKQSKMEIELATWIKKIIPNLVVKLDERIDGLEIDVYFPEHKFGVELNGLYWHGEVSGKKRHNYHSYKTQHFKNLGITIIQVHEDEWITNKDIVKSMILSKLGETPRRIFARKCVVKEISNKNSRSFLNNNHIQGYIGAKIVLGLYYNEELYGLMTFGKSRFNKKYDWELIRFCTKLNCSIVGGASKLLKYFEETYRPKNLISYADLRYSIGNLYYKLGFSLSHISTIDYDYVSPDRKHRYSRIRFQKHKLAKILPTFDPNLTEWQNMQLNGYDRIWDCGNMAFAKTYA